MISALNPDRETTTHPLVVDDCDICGIECVVSVTMDMTDSDERPLYARREGVTL